MISLSSWKALIIYQDLPECFNSLFIFGWSSGLGFYHKPIVSQHRSRQPNEGSGYDAKQSDGETSIMLDLCEIRSNPLLPSLPGPHLLGLLVRNRLPSIGQIELNCVLMLNWIVWNRTIYMHKYGFGIK